MPWVSTPPLIRVLRNTVLAESGCWEFQGTRATNGYGMVSVGGTTKRAHRVVWEVLNGPMPEGLESSHLCHNRICVNPSHIVAETHAQNNFRRRKAFCKRGHALTSDNRVGHNSECGVCKKLRAAEDYARKKDHVPA